MFYNSLHTARWWRSDQIPRDTCPLSELCCCEGRHHTIAMCVRATIVLAGAKV